MNGKTRLKATPPGRTLAATPHIQVACQGAALLIVLALLTLILMLALLTLHTGSQHARRQHLAADSIQADGLTRLPLNIVLAQIKNSAVDLPAGTAWASQPGMIRTFLTEAAGSRNSEVRFHHYRLYSAPVMHSATFNPAQEAASLTGWEEKPSGFTDLNRPVLTFRNSVRELIYPIADPSLLGVVDGYSLRAPAPAADGYQALPMPAAWIYVLKQGQLISPLSVDGREAVFDPEIVTPANPIVARIAFWTDDETSKLNVNTASEPEPWDTPAADSLTEHEFARNPPSPAEAYRISTHPAYTGAGVVLRHLGQENSSAPQELSAAAYQALVPDAVMNGNNGIRSSRKGALFPAVEDLVHASILPENRQDAGFRITPRGLRPARFLLTTHSSAPELNPWGQPKIALWMMPQNRAERSPADHRINTCSRLPGGAEFIFQRATDWRSPAQPGSSQSMTADWTGVLRNRELYTWLQALTDQPFPGFHDSFVGKYGRRSRNQILTSMVDMLRWSTNTESYLPPQAGAANRDGRGAESAVPLTINHSDGTSTRGFGRFPTVSEVAIVFAFTDVERQPDGRPLDANHDGICDRATRLRAIMVVNPFIAASGPPAAYPAWSFRIRRLQHFTIDQGIGLLLPGGNARNRCLPSPYPAGTAGSSALACMLSQFLQPDGTPKEPGNRGDPTRGFPFISSNDVRLPSQAGQPGTSIRFSGGAIIVDFLNPDAPLTSPQSNDAIHSVEMEFPDKPIPLPSLAVADFTDGPRSMDERFSPITISDGRRLPLIRNGDVVRSLVLNLQGISRGDARIPAAQREVLFASDEANRTLFAPHRDYDSQTTMMANGLPGAIFSGNQANTTSFPPSAEPDRMLGDWESGPGLLPNGPGLNRSTRDPLATLTRGTLPPDYTSPPPLPFSAVQFGGIPSGVFGNDTDPAPRPWQTLLFCPNPASRTVSQNHSERGRPSPPDHPGFASPPDHLWLELFWRPVLEPRPLSAGFATEGKVNLNFQIVPWTWLRRSTALHGALQGVRLTAIPSPAPQPKVPSAKTKSDGSPSTLEFRYGVDATRTLEAFEEVFDAGGIFRYPSEICSHFLIPRRLEGKQYEGPGAFPADPASQSAENLIAWWNGQTENPSDAFEATGDNLRESPYAQLYSRICTQSNVFRVHYHVQLLKKVPGTRAARWRENRDVIVSRRRGSYGIERRLDATAPLPDPATQRDSASLHTQYKLLITNHQRFNP